MPIYVSTLENLEANLQGLVNTVVKAKELREKNNSTFFKTPIQTAGAGNNVTNHDEAIELLGNVRQVVAAGIRLLSTPTLVK